MITDTPVATQMIYDFIENEEKARPQGNANRCSAASQCVRKNWYTNHGFIGEPLQPRARLNFMMGDLVESAIKVYIQKALTGPGKLYEWVYFGKEKGRIKIGGTEIIEHDQHNLTLEVPNGPTVTGHADGWGKRNLDSKIELFEIKSASDFGFDEFVRDGPGAYLDQAHSLMMTEELKKLEVDSVRFYYMRKNLGTVHDRLYEFNPTTGERVLENFRVSNGDKKPDQPYPLKDEIVKKIPTGRKTCAWQCQYCSHVKNCHGPFEVEFKNGKPIYFWTEKK